MTRTIESIHQITDDDVETLAEAIELLAALREYAQSQPEYEDTFVTDKQLTSLIADLEGVYEQLAVVYVMAQDTAIDPDDLISQMYDNSAGDDLEDSVDESSARTDSGESEE